MNALSLIERLRKVEGTSPDSIGISTCWHRNPDGPEAADAIEDLLEVAQQARDLLANSGAESGYCMCGDPVDSHSIGSGHAPVDAHGYYADSLTQRLDAALKARGEQS